MRNWIKNSRLRIHPLQDEAGLTLIEIMASMMIFLIVSAGVAGTMTAGLRTTAEARVATMGKSQAQQQIEEMRSRVFYVPYSSNPETGTQTDIDLLDWYFPNLTENVTTDTQGWRGWYTETSSDAYYTRECISSACAQGNLDINVRIETRFVKNQGAVVFPALSYNTNIPGNDLPPSNLVAVTVITSWGDGSPGNTYQLDSLISSTGQTVQGASEASGEQGCTATSRNYLEVVGGSFAVTTGTAEPYTNLINGDFGQAFGQVATGCEEGVTGRGGGGLFTIMDATTKAANVESFGPPDDADNSGPISIGPTAGWPRVAMTLTTAQADVDAVNMASDLFATGEGGLGTMTVSLNEIEGWTGTTQSGYWHWDFLNPAIEVVGTGASHQIFADLEQRGLHTLGAGDVHYQQINLLPMEAKSGATPSALQGLVFIRDFNATINSDAGDGSASNNILYSATIGMFDATKPATCTGDSCYDLYNYVGNTDPSKVAMHIAISLGNTTKYKLQRELFTQFHSFTATELNNATYESNDGMTATASIDALIEISARFGTGVTWKLDNPGRDQITVINPQGIADLSAGIFTVSLNEGA